MYIAKSFSISPLEIEMAWDYIRFRYALDYLSMDRDYETAKAGWEVEEMEQMKAKQGKGF